MSKEQNQRTLDDLKADPRCQARESMNQEALSEYQAGYEAGDTLPPIDVFDVDGEPVIVDGFHRFEAARRAGVLTLAVRIVGKGTMIEAQWHALASNQKHGLRRTREDKRRAVELALELDPDRSNREIARHLGVSDPFVGKMRREGQRPRLPQEWFDADLVPAWAVEAAKRFNDPDVAPETGVPTQPVSPRYFVRLQRLEFLSRSVDALSETELERIDAGMTLRDAELRAYERLVYFNRNIGVLEDLCAAMRREFEPEILAEIALAKKYGMDVWILRMYSAVIAAADACPDKYGDLPKLQIADAYAKLRERNPAWSGVGEPLPDLFPPSYRDNETWRDYAVQWRPECLAS